jgi:hypothetical protein
MRRRPWDAWREDCYGIVKISAKTALDVASEFVLKSIVDVGAGVPARLCPFGPVRVRAYIAPASGRMPDSEVGT